MITRTGYTPKKQWRKPMKKNNHTSAEIFYHHTLPTVSFEQFFVKKWWKKRIAELLPHLRELIGNCVIILAFSCLVMLGTWLFCVQLAEYGW